MFSDYTQAGRFFCKTIVNQQVEVFTSTALHVIIKIKISTTDLKMYFNVGENNAVITQY